MRNLALLASALLAAGLAHADNGYTLLPFAPVSISADGKTVVGEDEYANQLWTWSAAAGRNYIGGVTTINPGAGTPVLSRDGTRVAANAIDPVTGKSRPSYYSTATGTWTALPDYGTATAGTATVYGTTGVVWAMSSNGNYIAGYAYSGGAGVDNVRGSIWNVQAGTLTNLGVSGDSGNSLTRVNGISDDGRVAGGRGGNFLPMIWTDLDGDGSYTTLNITTVTGKKVNTVQAVSADGVWAGGQGGTGTGGAAYRYNVLNQTIESLGLLNPSSSGSAVTSMSADGSVIVGYENTAGAPQGRTGFIWRAGIGLQSFDSFLASYGIDTGNSLNFATPMDVSADGLSFTGFGYAPGDDRGLGWYVSIAGAVPEPSSCGMLMAGLGALGFAARRRRRRAG